MNPAILEAILNFSAERTKKFGELKTEREFLYIGPTVVKTVLVPVLYLCTSKHVIETFRKKAIFVEVQNFTYLKFDNVFKF